MNENSKIFCTRSGGKRIGSTKHGTASLDSVKTLPDHGDDRARSHVLDQTREERLAFEIGVVYRRCKLLLRL